jgi:protein TonB
METKKHQSKNNEALRLPLALTGFLFTGGLILASFTYVTPIMEEIDTIANSGEQIVQYVQEDDKTPETPPQQEENTYVAPPQPDIDTVDNIDIIPDPNPPILPPNVDVTIDRNVTIVEEVIEFPDVEASFPGGAAALNKFIVSNIQYPETSIDMEEQGKVYLSFVVETNGEISGLKVERGVSKDLDREAKRVLRSMPKWEPGEAGGKKVRTRCRLPIVFTLN